MATIALTAAFKSGQLVFSQPGALPAPALEQLVEAIERLDVEDATTERAS